MISTCGFENSSYAFVSSGIRIRPAAQKTENSSDSHQSRSYSRPVADVKSRVHLEELQVEAVPQTCSKIEVLSQQTIEKASEKLSEGCSVVMCEHVSLSEAKEFLEQNESSRTFLPNDSTTKECHNQIYGKLIATELPTHAHESVAACLTWEVFNGVSSLSGKTASVEMKTSPTIQIGNILKEPDLTISPIAGRGKRTARLPTVVFETAYRQSMKELNDALSQWLTSVRMAVGILEVMTLKNLVFSP